VAVFDLAGALRGVVGSVDSMAGTRTLDDSVCKKIIKSDTYSYLISRVFCRRWRDLWEVWRELAQWTTLCVRRRSE